MTATPFTKLQPGLRYRPVFGGVFGKSGEYVLATMPCVERGLYATRYMVLHPRSGGVLSVASDKLEALAGARRLLKAAESLARHKQAANEPLIHQEPLWPVDQMPAVAGAAAVSKAVPRRRREVFERTGGKCFYCGQVLTLDGKWHIEHQMPRALMGPDELPNLVAACVPCNLAKGDRTALEFLVR
jgi:hypothetical protein